MTVKFHDMIQELEELGEGLNNECITYFSGNIDNAIYRSKEIFEAKGKNKYDEGEFNEFQDKFNDLIVKLENKRDQLIEENRIPQSIILERDAQIQQKVDCAYGLKAKNNGYLL